MGLKGQSSVEYLVLLAMVLIVALIAIVLLGGLPMGTQDTMGSESLAYWSSTRPFQITEWAQQGSTMYLSVVNGDSRRLVLQSISIGNATVSLSPGWVFAPSAKKNVTVAGLAMCNITTYDTFEYSVNFSFDSSEINGMGQYGTKPLTGRCIFA